MRRSERFGSARNSVELARLFELISPNLGEFGQIIKSVCGPDSARGGRCSRNVALFTFFSHSGWHGMLMAIVFLLSSVILLRMLHASLGPFGKLIETLIWCEMHQLVKVLIDLL